MYVHVHARSWTGYSKLPLGVNECVHGTLQWTGVLSRVYSV